MCYFAKRVVGIAILLIGTGTTAFAQPAADLANTLISNEPSSAAWQTAAATVRAASADVQGAVASAMVANVTASAEGAVKTVLMLNKLAPRGGTNPLSKLLGPLVQGAFGGLMNVVRDPLTKEGQTQLNGLLSSPPFSLTDNEIFDIIERLQELARAKTKKKKNAGTSRGNSVSFDSSSGILSFDDDFMTAVSLARIGLTTNDPIVGALVDFGDFVVDEFLGPDGEFLFTAVGEPQFSIRKDDDLFLTGEIPYLTFSGNTFTGVVTFLALSGAAPDSLYFDALPDLGSTYIDELQQGFASRLLRDTFAVTFTPDLDFAALTNGFARDVGGLSIAAIHTSPGTNGTHRAIPEPSVLLLILSGVAAAGARRRQRRRA